MEVLSTVAAAESEVQSENLRTSQNYLRSTGKEELAEGIQRDFKTLLEDPEAGFEDLRDRLGQPRHLGATAQGARTLALRKRIRSSLSWKVPAILY